MFLTVSHNEFSATDILLEPGDFCSHVILVERRHFDVHAFCHSRSFLEAEIDRLSAAVSSGFARGKVRKAPTSKETKEKKTH